MVTNSRWLFRSANGKSSDGIYFTAIIRDIRNRKANETKIQHLTQMYAALSQCNKAIVHSSNEQELFEQVCQAAVKSGGMQMAWIGMVDSDQRVRPVTSSGIHTDYLDDIDIVLDADSDRGRGPTAIAIREDRPYWCDDFMQDPASLPWRKSATEAGWRASAALPLHRDGKVVGAFTIYCTDPYAFDKSVRALLLEMATDISYALGNLARESQRRQANILLHESEQKLNTIFSSMLDGVLVIDIDYQSTHGRKPGHLQYARIHRGRDSRSWCFRYSSEKKI